MEDGQLESISNFTIQTYISDFWELPASKHTDALASKIEENFYMRCSEEKRPVYLRGTTASSKNLYESESKQLKQEEIDTRSGAYDESLFKAILNVFKNRIIWSSILLLVSGLFRFFLC
jgi:hypothetical protein